MDEAVRAALRDLLRGAVAFDVPMARHTSLRVGGPADAVASPEDRETLAALLSLCADRGVPWRTLGAGFNTLVRDEGVTGVVLRLTRFRTLREEPGPCVRAEAGVSHASLTRLCARRGLAGLEFGAGIPGTVGGWLAMNAGIGTREVKDVVREMEMQVPGEPAPRRVPAEALRFRYRALEGVPAGSVLLSAVFAVAESEPAAVQAEIDALLARRAATQPLDVPSCGSVFKNPPGDHAGRLIEAAGLKGERAGGAEISTRHANFIVNRGGASARDVLALVERARKRVAERTGIVLETEVRIWGRTG